MFKMAEQGKPIERKMQKGIVDLYVDGYSIGDISVLTKTSAQTVTKYLVLAEKLPPVELTSAGRDEIFPSDARFLGYICGLIASDGCLRHNSHEIQIALHKNDREVLVEVSKRLCGKDLVKPASNPNAYVFIHSLPLLYKYCLSIGITPNKSKTLCVDLDKKSNTFKWHFLRGLLDGDGTVNAGSKDRRDDRICIYTASEHFATMLCRNFPEASLTRAKKDSVWSVYWAGRHNLEEFLSKIPREGEPYFMKRKSQRMRDLEAKFKDKDGNGQSWNSGSIRVFDPIRGDYFPFGEIARFYGVINKETAYHRVKYHGWTDYFSAAVFPHDFFANLAVAMDSPYNLRCSEVLKKPLLGVKRFIENEVDEVKYIPTSILDPVDRAYYKFKDLVKKYGVVKYSTAKQRVYMGWAPYKAATTPLKNNPFGIKILDNFLVVKN